MTDTKTDPLSARTLLQGLRANLAAGAGSPSQLHERGTLFREISRTEAYQIECHPSLNAFIKSLGRSYSGCSKGAVANACAISEGFDPAWLTDPTIPQRSLLAILKAPREQRPALLHKAAGLTFTEVEALVADLLPSPSPCATPAQGEILAQFSAFVDDACQPPSDPKRLQDIQRCLHRCQSAVTAAAQPHERRAEPRGDIPPEDQAEPKAEKKTEKKFAGPPPRLRQGRDCLAVPVPILDGEDREPNPLEVHVTTLIVLFKHLTQIATLLHDAPTSDWTLRPDRLQLAFLRTVGTLHLSILHLKAALAEVAAAQAEALKRRSTQGDPPLSIDEMLPVPELLLRSLHQGLPVPLCGYTVFEEDDPLDEPIANPSVYDRLMFRAIGVMNALQRHLRTFRERCREGHSLDPSFFYQLHECLLTPLGLLNSVAGRSRHQAELAERREKEQEAKRPKVTLSLRENLVVLGENRVPDQYIIIGFTRDGRPVAISAFTPQVLVALGTQGWGKSHLSVLLAECCALAPESVCRMAVPPRSIWFASDWQQGIGNHQALSGFDINPYPAQRRTLREIFQVKGGYCYERGTLLCLPGSKARLSAKYADLVEMGLRIEEIRLHVSEHGQFGVGQFLTLGPKGIRGKGLTQAHQFVESLIALMGPELTLPLLREQIEDAKLDRRCKAALLTQLQFLEGITSEHEYLIDVLEDEAPVFVLLESRYLSRESMLTLEMVLVNALSRPLRSGKDPMRWIFMDELSKRAMTDHSGAFMKGFASEVRHRPVSLGVAGQLCADLPIDFLGLATIVALFHLSSERDYRRVQAEAPGFDGIPLRLIREQGRGVARMSATRATDPLFTREAQEVLLRPSLVHAGGETLTAF